FARGEAKALEQVVEGIAPVRIRPDGGSVTAFQGRRLEQPAVQERQLSQRACGRGSLGGGAVEDAETQRVQGGAVEVAAGGQRAIEQARQIAAVAVEPALLLYEIEEEHARQGGEREGVPVDAAPWPGEAIGEALEHGAEGAEESRRDALGAERLADPDAQRKRRFVGPGGEPLQQGEIG